MGLSNGWKLPVITSIVCLTGNFNAEPCFGETWLRAGNPSTPKGAIAFFGASPPTTHSRWNNCLDFGIYHGLLQDSIYFLGPMTYRGKMEVYVNFPLETSPDSGSEFYFNAYNLLGDPSLEVWTDVPKNLIVNHQSTIPVGTNKFSVQVLNSLSQPVKGAMVCLYKRNETKTVEFTDASGIANFQIITNTPDTLFVTVTKHNFKPYCGYAIVNNSAVYVGYYSHMISDPGGNNNGEINPGETINLTITLKNFGNSTTATNVIAKLSTTDPLVAITDSVKNYGNIAPGSISNSSPFVFNVSQNIKNNHMIKFNLTVSSSQGNWNSVLWLVVKAPEFEYRKHFVLDGGNGVLEPGESSDLVLSIKNIGGLIGSNIQGILRSLNPGINVIDSLGSFGNISIGDSATNSGDVFKVIASSQLTPGHEIKFLTTLYEN
ncbi:MAG: C25 family cysteine peptidase, partial [candidate division WOR-3 bacterium]|nr:C25 family cysteine peptidase [candidate division WOR-3 bacterium]